MGIIRLLPSKLVNQIAAGEVVERPASVVKELVENAIDAGALSIRVRCSLGGTAGITVIDDGVGMSPDDALACVRRHATSKLPTDDSLFAIVTKGFRGEALPSIASVSKFRLETSVAEAAVGTRVTLDGGDPPSVEPCAPVHGTRIDVDELFFNVPARRKFLKRESTELVHCQEAVIRLALSHPEVAFVFEHNEKVLFSLGASPRALDDRLGVAVGREAEPHLLSIEERRLGVTVTGRVASPEFTMSTARGLYTFVNRRYVRDRGLLSGIARAFQESLPPGRQPVGAIFIEVDPAAVDVNVHPQKLEVRFADSRQVIDALSVALTSALRRAPFRGEVMPVNSAQAQAHYAQAVDRFLSRASDGVLTFEPLQAADRQHRPSFGTAAVDLNTAPPKNYFSQLRFLGDLGRRYWVCEGAGASLVVVDSVAVRQRLAFHSLSGALDNATLKQSSLAHTDAQVVNSASLVSQAFTHGARLKSVGLVVERFGETALVVRRIPDPVADAQLALLLSDVLEAFEANTTSDVPALLAMATHAAGTLGRTHSHDEVRRMLTALDDVEHFRFEGQRRLVVHDVPLLSFERD